MAVTVRISRIGKKKAPFHRIVAIDKRAKRDGQYIENLGTFNPLTGEIVQFHADKIQAWVEKGAQVSDAVLKIKKMHAAKNTVEPVAKVAAVKKTPSAKAKSEKVAKKA